jgi:hypothetical protein
MHRNIGRLVAILLVMTAAASAIEIKVLALDSKNWRPDKPEKVLPSILN